MIKFIYETIIGFLTLFSVLFIILCFWMFLIMGFFKMYAWYCEKWIYASDVFSLILSVSTLASIIFGITFAITRSSFKINEIDK